MVLVSSLAKKGNMDNTIIQNIRNHLEYLGYEIDSTKGAPGFNAKADSKELYIRVFDDIVHILWGASLPNGVGC